MHFDKYNSRDLIKHIEALRKSPNAVLNKSSMFEFNERKTRIVVNTIVLARRINFGYKVQISFGRECEKFPQKKKLLYIISEEFNLAEDKPTIPKTFPCGRALIIKVERAG